MFWMFDFISNHPFISIGVLWIIACFSVAAFICNAHKFDKKYFKKYDQAIAELIEKVEKDMENNELRK
jgi:hypothetical protein